MRGLPTIELERGTKGAKARPYRVSPITVQLHRCRSWQ